MKLMWRFSRTQSGETNNRQHREEMGFEAGLENSKNSGSLMSRGELGGALEKVLSPKLQKLDLGMERRHAEVDLRDREGW